LISNTQTAGSYVTGWNGTDAHGKRLPHGNYYFVLKTGFKEERIKVIKLS
jgi:hypothetical protein